MIVGYILRFRALLLLRKTGSQQIGKNGGCIIECHLFKGQGGRKGDRGKHTPPPSGREQGPQGQSQSGRIVLKMSVVHEQNGRLQHNHDKGCQSPNWRIMTKKCLGHVPHGRTINEYIQDQHGPSHKGFMGGIFVPPRRIESDTVGAYQYVRQCTTQKGLIGRQGRIIQSPIREVVRVPLRDGWQLPRQFHPMALGFEIASVGSSGSVVIVLPRMGLVTDENANE